MGKKLLFLSKEKKIEVESDNNILDLFSVFNEERFLKDDNRKSLKLFIDDNKIDLLEDNIKKEKKDLETVVNNDFIYQYDENVVVLTGAGSSIIELSEKSGKTMRQIVNALNEEEDSGKALDYLKNIVKCKNKDNDKDDENDKHSDNDNININLEDLLSKAKMYEELGIEDNIGDSIKKIEDKIREYCTLKYDKDYFKHGEFLSKFLKRKNNDERLKIFTTNYDTLFEQAASDERIVVIDGFSFTNPSKFDGRYFDYDIVERQYGSFSGENSYIDNVIHLYKLHGSIDWVVENNEVVKKYNVNNDERDFEYLMIYPASTKFKQTYETPYFELFSRFISELKKKNTILIIIGFSFADEHLKTIVENALKTNRSLRILYVDVNLENENIKFLKDAAQSVGNVMLLSSTFSDFVTFIKDKKIYGNSYIGYKGDVNE
ncbi:SIR2 family protein [Marinitoga sp. 1135]|uniref:SIR2 family protein n=1 Tax=Marinitoga sp. 1135 TaxID=1643333 RepID=UPI001586E0D6|nr:SIR2 family protein [Marinitoga sp. 1135]